MAKTESPIQRTRVRDLPRKEEEVKPRKLKTLQGGAAPTGSGTTIPKIPTDPIKTDMS